MWHSLYYEPGTIRTSGSTYYVVRVSNNFLSPSPYPIVILHTIGKLTAWTELLQLVTFKLVLDKFVFVLSLMIDSME